VKVKIINKNSADVRVSAVRARRAPKIIKMNIIEKRRKAKRRKARYYCTSMKFSTVLANDCCLNDGGIVVRFPARAEDFTPKRPDRLWGSPASCSICTGNSFLEGMAAGA
jgi:hypothetical protein